MSVQQNTWWRPQHFQSVFPHVSVVLVYTLLALVVTWPVATHFSSGIVGRVGGVDAYQNAWNLWWVAYATTHGSSPFETPLLYYPHGIHLFWQTLGFSQGILALPITLLAGPLAGFNFTLLTSFILSGYVTFLFARHLTRSNAAGLVAGAIFAFSPFHLEKVLDGNLEVAAIQWVPCFAFALYHLLERPSWRWSLLSGAGLLWVSLGSWYYGLFCLFYTGCAIIVWTLLRTRSKVIRLVLWGATPLLLWMLILAPAITALAQTGDTMLSDLRSMHIQRSADLLDFFLPNPVHPWWGSAVRDMREGLYPNSILWNVALGSVGWLLAALGMVTQWRHSWRWALLLVATLILAMGPVLRVAGHTTGIPLPFALVQDLPGIRAGQRPNHMALLSSLMLALLAGYGVAWLMPRFEVAHRGMLALALVGLVVAVDGYAGPLRIVTRPIHPFYTSLPQPTGDGALMPLPVYYNINRSENLTPQMVHHWPILAGYVARPPTYPFVEYAPGVRELQTGHAIPDDIVIPGWPEVGRRGLAAYAIRYVTLDLTSDKDNYFAQVRTRIAELGFGAPLAADATLEAYAIPDTWPVGPVGFLGPGWQPLEQQDANRWRWMGETAEIWLFNPLAHPVAATVGLTAASYQQPRQVQLALDAVPLGQVTVAPDQMTTRNLRLLLPPGEHHLVLQAEAAPDPNRAGQAISVQVFRVEFRFEDEGYYTDTTS